jgi:hypothetical protein
VPDIRPRVIAYVAVIDEASAFAGTVMAMTSVATATSDNFNVLRIGISPPWALTR